MKTPEEIKEIKTGLECCASGKCPGVRGECPYQYTIICVSAMAGQARKYIDQLEERISLMLIQMHGDCGCCKHRGGLEIDQNTGYEGEYMLNEVCKSCLNEADRPKWEYEGLPIDE